MTPAADAWITADPTVCPICGRDGCEEHLPAEGAPTPVARPVLVFQSAADIIATPPPVEILEGIAWAGCVTLLVAESGVGKTFVTLSQAAAVSAGSSWYGRRTEAGAVAYLSYEGDALGLRCRALRDVQGQALEHVHLLRPHAPLSPRLGRDGVEEPSMGELAVMDALDTLRADLEARRMTAIRLLIVDTVRASLSGSEDASEHAAAYLRVVRRLLTHLPGAAAILTHHAGWQDGDQKRKRERGSSAWRGNVDGTLYLEAGEADARRRETPIVLHTHKARDAERSAPLHLVRRVVDLGDVDRYGRPRTSCVIEADPRSRQDRDAERQAAADAEHHVFDLRTLRTIIERPDMATSQDKLRMVLGVRKAQVADAVTRLVQRGWALPGSRQQPYHVTTAGFDALGGAIN